jgi:hypothetical protein
MTHCSWCERPTENVQFIEIYDEGSELPTGTAPVCADCLELLEEQ